MHRRFLRILVSAIIFISTVGLLLAEPAPTVKPVVIPNPNLQASCGLDVILVLDESGSISGGSITAVRNAAQAFVNGLLNTGSELAIVEFNSVARRPINYTPVTDITRDTIFLPYLYGYAQGGHAANYNPAQESGVAPTTNWDDALEEVKLINANAGFAPLVVFITDGDPTAYNFDADGETGGYISSSGNQSVWRPILEANAIKNQGSHILAVGINLSTSGLLKLQDISGSDIYIGGALNLTTIDLMVVTNFAALQTELAKVAVQLCQSSLVIHKQVDNANGQGYVPAPGWQFNTNVTVVGNNPANYQWVLPEPAPTIGAVTHTGITGPAGSITFQWKPNNNINSGFSVTELQQPGYVLNNVACIVRKENNVEQSLTLNRSGNTFGTTAGAIAPQDFVTCTVQNGLLNIGLEKTVGASSTGPWEENISLPPQTPVWWRLVITNNGAAAITNFVMNDPPFGNLVNRCLTPPPTTLAIGASYTCIFPDTTAAHSVTNTAQVQGCNGNVCKTAQDSASYTILTSSLMVQKQVFWNGAAVNPAQTFEICIQGPSYPTTPNCKPVAYLGGDLIWLGILPGQYTITEKNPGEAWDVTVNTPTVEVTAQGGVGKITNTYRLGKLTVTKQVNWNGVSPNSSQTFEICIQGASYPAAPNCKSIGHSGGDLIWTDLLPGQYQITETNPGAVWEVAIPTPSINVTVQGSNGTVINTHRLAKLSVTKQVNWNGITPNPAQTFQICITGLSYPNGDCKPVDFDGETITWENLIPGQYTISETNPGTNWLTTISQTAIEATVEGAAATLQNTHRLGKLTVTKTVDWGSHEINLAQTFEICIQGASYPTPNCQTIDADGGDLVWNDLIPGEYIVSETNPGVDWLGMISGSPVFVTVDGGIAQITNTYSPPIVCDDSNRDPLAHLQSDMWPHFNSPQHAVATVTNTSDICAYEIALVAYRKYDETLIAQTPYSWTPSVDLATFLGGVDGTSIIIHPGETLTLTVPIPTCAVQVDLVFDADHLHPLYADAATAQLDIVPLILPAFYTDVYGAYGNRYDQRLLTTNHTNWIDPTIPYCTP